MASGHLTSISRGCTPEVNNYPRARLIGLDNDALVGAEDWLASDLDTCWAVQDLDLMSNFTNFI